MRNIRTISLNAPVGVEDGYTLICQGDALADTFGASAEGLTGSCSATFIRPDGVTIQITGSVSSGTASVTLPAECYYYSGAFVLAVQLTANSVTSTIRLIRGVVARTSSDVLLDRDAAYSLSELTELLNAKLNAPTAAGTANQVLVSDGNGGTLWATPAAATSAGKLAVNGTSYQVRTGTDGAAGYLTFVLEG